MSEHETGNSPSVRTRALAIGLIVVAVTAVFLFVRGRSEEEEVGGSTPAPDMGSMPGMSMSGDGSVRLTAAQIRQFGITFDFVEQRTLQSEVRTVGMFTLDETRIAEVVPKFAGFVERLYVDFTGQPVRQGAELLDVYSPEVIAAQEELLVAVRLQREVGGSTIPGGLGGGPALAEMARERLRLWDVSDAQIEEVLRTGRPRRTVTLYAPVGGVVVEKPVVLGQGLQPGQVLYRIADLSRLWVEAELRESDAALVQVGSPATVEPPAFPGRVLSGRVEYVSATLSPEARTLRARIAVPNPGGTLRPGMYATVRLEAPLRTALTVPSTAVVNTGTRRVVFVDLGGGRLLPQEVETGRTAGELTEVLSGLEPGQRVVTSAQYLLDSESNIAEVMRSMLGQGQAGMDGMPGMDMGAPGADTRDMPGMDMPGMEE